MRRVISQRRRIVPVMLLVLGLAVPAQAVSGLKQYETPPAIDLKTLDGTSVTSDSLKNRPAILMFGELYNRNTIKALGALDKVFEAMQVEQADAPVFLIVAHDVPAEELGKTQREKKIEATILHDPSRLAFGAYGVVVLPSVVVLDREGKVCTAVSGYPLSFGDLMTDALRFALGQMTREQLEAAAQAPAEESVDENRLRAQRQASLAYQLFRRGLAELAMTRYEQAIQIDPQYLPSRVGLARCLIRLNRLDRAVEQLAWALKEDPKHVDANLAMVYVEIQRGGEDLKSAQERLSHLLLYSPHNAEAHYLAGLVYEGQDDKDRALAEFKKAAQMLLERRAR